MILLTFGTRPEYIKIKPLIKVFKENSVEFSVLFTGQHTSLLNKIDKKDKRVIEIVNGESRLDSIVSSILNKNSIFSGISSVLVQGDTTSALSVAIAAFHRKIRVIHLEAGLRTFDFENPYPEEANRQLISRISNLNLCPTKGNRANLLNERVLGTSYIVGNTVLDNLVDLETSYENKVIVTMHRRENHPLIPDWFLEVEKLANKYKDLDFILPIHPNPNVLRHRDIFEKVKVTSPMDYEDFIKHIASCKLVITDSGGIQEECSFLRKKTIVCRTTTERREVLNKFSFLCDNPKELGKIFTTHIKNYIPKRRYRCPYGNGFSSKKIIGILKEKGYV